MTDFITLTCPSCGSRLEITEDINRFACTHCGNEHIVKRGGGIISLEPIIKGIADIQVGVDKTASELAIVRLEKEISILEVEISSINTKHPESCSTAIIIPSLLVMIIGWLVGRYLVSFFQREMNQLNPRDLTYILDNYIVIFGNVLQFLAYAATAIFLISVIVSISSNAQRRHLIEEESKPLNDKLEQKKQELKNHQQIVLMK